MQFISSCVGTKEGKNQLHALDRPTPPGWHILSPDPLGESLSASAWPQERQPWPVLFIPLDPTYLLLAALRSSTSPEAAVQSPGRDRAGADRAPWVTSGRSIRPLGPQHLHPSVNVLGPVSWGCPVGNEGRGRGRRRVGSQRRLRSLHPCSNQRLSLRLLHVLGLPGEVYLVF